MTFHDEPYYTAAEAGFYDEAEELAAELGLTPITEEQFAALVEQRHLDPAGVPDTELEKLYHRTRPIPGRPGWRIDAQSRQWFSSEWLVP